MGVWNEIGEKMLQADAIIFGAPNYYGTINALGHACLERTFCFRHREIFNLAGKLAVSVSVSYGREAEDPVHSIIKKFMKSNMMAIIDTVSAKGYAQCYTCGYGHDCGVGNVVRDHGFLERIEDKHYPACFEEQENTKFQTYRVGKLLGAMLHSRNKM
ncbi:MAG: flavodoxin family protein [Bacillota bacterium]